jgi:acyl dehydratase
MPIAIDQELPELVTAPLSADDFARYAEASGDHNPLHLDHAAALAAGQPTVIAHGMLVMGLLGRVATEFVGAGRLHELHTRFVAPTRPGETLHCGGRVTTVEATRIGIELWARNAAGELKAIGSAVAAWDHETV